jgi:hypothetical protein
MAAVFGRSVLRTEEAAAPVAPVAEMAENGSERLFPAPTVDGENDELRNFSKTLARPARLELATFRSATSFSEIPGTSTVVDCLL